MSTDTAMVPVNIDVQLPSTQLGSDDVFAELAQGGDYLGRMQLYTKGKAVNKAQILPGHYGIPESNDNILDLGMTVHLLPLARRPKAIDMTDTEALVISYDVASDEFQRIRTAADQPESHCQYGPSFLVYEPGTNRFLEFFCGNKSNRIEAKKIYPFLPLTQADIDAKAAAGNDVSGLVPHGPIPLTLTVQVAENKRGSWHVPVVNAAAFPLKRIPPTDAIVREIVKFLSVKDNGVEKVNEAAQGRAR